MSVPPPPFEIIPPPTVLKPCLVFRNACKETFRPMKLHFAINKNDLDKVKSLVNENVDLNYKVFNQTPLGVAIFQECFDIACYLVDNGASLDFRESSKFKHTPLHLAVKSGCVELVEKMVKIKPDLVKMRDFYGMTALHWAALNVHKKMVKVLVGGGAEVDGVNNKGMSALHMAVIGYNYQSVEYLLSLGADANLRDNDACTALMKASSRYLYDIVQLLLIKGQADPNLTDQNGLSCLHLVCKSYEPNELFLRHFSSKVFDIDIKHKNNAQDVMMLLLDHGADVDLGTEDTGNPLQWALSLDDLHIANLLLQAGSLPSEDVLFRAQELSTQVSRPLSLVMLCKKIIRKKLNRFNDEKITQLDLPPLLKDYLRINY